MKKLFISVVVLGFVLCSLFTYVYSESATTVDFTVNENVVTKNIDSKMYGINYEWGSNGDGSSFFIEPVENSIKLNQKYINCFLNDLPFTRMAGMSANSMYWKKAIGSLAEREEQQFWYFSSQKQRYGLVEWLGGNLRADAFGEFAYTVNLKDNENLADLVRFLRLMPDDPKAIGTDGTNWAQRRIDLGIPNPVPIAVWELGNEVDCSPTDGGFGWGIYSYLPACQEAINIISGIDTNPKFSVQVKSDYWVTGWENWHRRLLETIGDKIDYISVHQYYNWEKQDVGANSVYQKLEKDIFDYTGENRIKFYVSEHSVSPPLRQWSTAFEYMLPHTLGGTLATAEFYLRSALRPSIAMSTYHSINSASWITAYEYRGDVYLTAIGNLLHIMNKNFCGDFLSSTLDGYDIDAETTSCAGAVKTDDGINVMLLNRGQKAVTFNFHFNKKYNLNSRSYISGGSNQADNYRVVTQSTGYDAVNKQEISYAYDEIENIGDIKSYTVQPYTMMMLNLKEVKSSFSNDFETYNLAESYNNASFTDEYNQGVSGQYLNAIINNGPRKDEDYTGDVYSNGVYEGNAANNIWTYNDLQRRSYGGLEGYKGYVYPNDDKCNYNRFNHRLSVLSVLNNSNKVLLFLPAQRDNTNVVSCFGADNISVSNGGWLKADLAFIRDLPQAKLQLIANPTGLNTDQVTLNIAEFSSDSFGSQTADIIFDGKAIGTVSVSESTSDFTTYHLEYGFSDNTHKFHRLIVKEAATGDIVADSGWKINSAASTFDGTKVYGVRVMLSTLKRSEPKMYLDNFEYVDMVPDFPQVGEFIYTYSADNNISTDADNVYAFTTTEKKNLSIVINNKIFAINNKLIYTEYDTNGVLLSVKVLKAKNQDVSIGNNASYGKIFLFNNLTKIKPLYNVLWIDYR